MEFSYTHEIVGVLCFCIFLLQFIFARKFSRCAHAIHYMSNNKSNDLSFPNHSLQINILSFCPSNGMRFVCTQLTTSCESNACFHE